MMERLTRPCADTNGGKYISHVAGDYIGIYPECTLGKVVKRLAAYEDTGLEPEDFNMGLNAAVRKKVGAEYYGLTPEQMEHAADLFHADQEGRLVVLPCRMDATVYDIRRFYKGRKIVRREIVSGEIDHFTIGEAGKPVATVCLHGNEWADYEPEDLILTREEAEKALGAEAAI